MAAADSADGTGSACRTGGAGGAAEACSGSAAGGAAEAARVGAAGRAGAVGDAGTATAGSGGAAGYSGTPLFKKLGVKSGHQVVLRHAPAGWQIPDLPEHAAVRRRAAPRGAAADITVAFCRSRRELERDAAALMAALAADGVLWIAWPRRAGGHSSDITENCLRDLLLPFGVVDVKVAALGNDWSALKFVWRKRQRGARHVNS